MATHAHDTQVSPFQGSRPSREHCNWAGVLNLDDDNTPTYVSTGMQSDSVTSCPRVRAPQATTLTAS